MLRPLVVITAAFAVLIAPPAAQAVSPRALAKRHFAVLRTAERAGDRVPGLSAPGLLTRRVARVDGRTVWLGVRGRQLCLWLRTDHGGHAESCSRVARALAPASPVAMVYGARGLTAAVALPDGCSDARLQRRGGSEARLRIRRSALVLVTKASGSRLVWRAQDGSERALPVSKP
jgi:hypothetical protein